MAESSSGNLSRTIMRSPSLRSFLPYTLCTGFKTLLTSLCEPGFLIFYQRLDIYCWSLVKTMDFSPRALVFS